MIKERRINLFNGASVISLENKLDGDGDGPKRIIWMIVEQ